MSFIVSEYWTVIGADKARVLQFDLRDLPLSPLSHVINFMPLLCRILTHPDLLSGI